MLSFNFSHCRDKFNGGLTSSSGFTMSFGLRQVGVLEQHLNRKIAKKKFSPSFYSQNQHFGYSYHQYFGKNSNTEYMINISYHYCFQKEKGEK
jgi:hypothetical protein